MNGDNNNTYIEHIATTLTLTSSKKNNKTNDNTTTSYTKRKTTSKSKTTTTSSQRLTPLHQQCKATMVFVYNFGGILYTSTYILRSSTCICAPYACACAKDVCMYASLCMMTMNIMNCKVGGGNDVKCWSCIVLVVFFVFYFWLEGGEVVKVIHDNTEMTINVVLS